MGDVYERWMRVIIIYHLPDGVPGSLVAESKEDVLETRRLGRGIVFGVDETGITIPPFRFHSVAGIYNHSYTNSFFFFFNW